MKRICALMLCLALLVCGIELSTDGNFAFGEDGFSDLKPSHWAYSAVSDMVDQDVIAGYPDGSFQPEGVVTFGEFLKMAVIAASGENPGTAESTATVKKHWAQNYYELALKKGYFTDADISKSALNQQIPRASMALIISGILGDDVKVENDLALRGELSDVDGSTRYEYQITKVYGTGILSGYPDGTFRPNGTLTRAEAASVIRRLTDESKRVLPKIEIPTGGAVATDSALGDNVIMYDPDTGKEPFPVKYVKTGPASEVINNLDFIDPAVEGFVSEGFFKNAKTYYILESSEPFNISTMSGVITTRNIYIDGDLQRGFGLLKEGVIIKALQPTMVDTETGQRGFGEFIDNIPDFDYIASCGTDQYGNSAKVVYLIPNPFN